MSRFKLILGITSLLMSAYFFVQRFDIIEEAFNRGMNAVKIGELILPAILLLLGIVLIIPSKKKPGNHDT